MLDARAATLEAANNLLRVLRVLMRFALERGMVKADPTAGIRKLRRKSDGFHSGPTFPQG